MTMFADQNIDSHASAVVDNLISSAIFSICTILLFRRRNQIVQFFFAVWHSLVAWITRKRYILFWNDVQIHYSYALIDAVKSQFPRYRLRAIEAPSKLQDYFLHPTVVSSLVLIDADVSKFATDRNVASRIERLLTGFLMRGGGIVGTHDVIYSRVRNNQLQTAFGGSVYNFQRTATPIKYLLTAAGREHSLSKYLPESFELDDGEVIWGDWEKDCTIHYETIFGEKTIPVVVSRKHLNGRLVWAHSGDKGHTLAKSIADPQKDFVRLIASAIVWVSKENRVLRQEETCLVVAHRGASLSRHENTLEAFTLATTIGADYVELDVRRTSDGFLIVHHDSDVNGRPITSNTLEALKSSARDRGYLLATLESVLKSCQGKVKFDIELKEEGYEEYVLKFIRNILPDREFVITSFSDLSLQKVKRLFGDVRCGLLLGRANPSRRFMIRWTELFPVRRAIISGADFIVPHVSLLRFGFSKRLRAMGFPLWVWTVDEPPIIQTLLGDWSVEAIITNAPDVVIAARERMAKKEIS